MWLHVAGKCDIKLLESYSSMDTRENGRRKF